MTDYLSSIDSISAQDIIDSDLDPATYGAIPAGLSITRRADGSINEITAGYANRGTLKTRGVDFRLNTNFDFGAFGALRNMLTVSYLDKYDLEDSTGQMVDQLNLAGTPDRRATLANQWSYGDFKVEFNTNYIGGQDRVSSTTGLRGPGGYATNDLQFSWKAPWNGTIAVGATNIGDRYPELITYDGRPWNFYLYDAYGRTTYFRYTQKF